jgi:pimeloyl-ACP methyl ester carboxylesterase
MEKVRVNDVELEYEVTGDGEPVLLISPVIADGLSPLTTHPALADHYRLIRYHRRGWAGSTHTRTPTTIVDHAVDAAALLDRLGFGHAHVVGHSSGAVVALQLALDFPQSVDTLALLELPLFSVPSAPAFFEEVGPAFAAYECGDRQGAVAGFFRTASGLDWDTCHALLDEHVPGAFADAVRDADTLFGVELPALSDWSLDATKASTIRQPVLSVLGSETSPLWVESAAELRAVVPTVEDATIEGLGHFLHMQRPAPVADRIALFLGAHAVAQRTASAV